MRFAKSRPEAEKAGVILGLENTISAEDNVRIMDRARSKAVLVYYDIGNSTKAGFNVAREIDWLGKKRICQMHFKDNPNYLGRRQNRHARSASSTVSRIGLRWLREPGDGLALRNLWKPI